MGREREKNKEEEEGGEEQRGETGGRLRLRGKQKRAEGGVRKRQEVGMRNGDRQRRRGRR